MPDNPEPRLIPNKDRLKAGRRPEWLEPTVPYRVEEWGKSAAYIVPKGYHPAADGTDPPYPRRVGRPGMGTLASYIGANALAPRPDFAPKKYRVVLEGHEYTEAEAEARVKAWLKARALENSRKARRRLKSSPAAGAPRSGSGSASRAK